MPSPITLGLAGLALLCGGAAVAQDIYSCVDARGRTITADRPIPECSDRTQRELSRNGLLKRQIGPSLTAHEQAAQDEKDRQAAEIRAREAEDKRRDRALLLRYPTRAVHDQERTAALLQIDEVIKASIKRRGELADQRKAIASELEFYAKDLSRAPASLKRRLEENEGSVAVQQKFIADQEQEKKRVNLRFDEELAKLKQLWPMVSPPIRPGASASKVGKN
ncbi:DUF4124 domain-containing protein [Polaromonas naphthalenivorans]|uniref:DUF4124 domain-containing protein n=1 Tax=Polaromonas naphthalenivorans TaxID=216465 RepID=UPI001E64932C|nr:DUF4124 domain-containing protein [Polaromonas naphthalenivorans]